MFLIVGFTHRTSFSLARYLLKQHTVIISDKDGSEHKQKLFAMLDGDVVDELGCQDSVLLDRYPIQKIFLSPGVPRSIPLIQEALSRGIEVLNDIEYFYREFPDRTYIAITGTDGKTTASSWLGDVFSREKKTILAGNVGTPIFEYADKQYNDYIFIVELSSFQLESLCEFHAHIAVITNINDDHLDRYAHKDEYAFTKKNIFNNQKGHDFALLYTKDDYTKKFVPLIDSQVLLFSETSGDLFIEHGNIIYNKEIFCSADIIRLCGQHNKLNAMVVIAIASLMSISKKSILASLSEFTGIPHRLQYLGDRNRVSFYNDSKATTVQSVYCALDSFDVPVILLAGGRSKDIDFASLASVVHQKTKVVLCFGELGQYLSQVWGATEVFVHMKDAVLRACTIAQEGDVVLLSPGGTSFDEYDSFEQRGNHFQQLVEEFYSS